MTTLTATGTCDICGREIKDGIEHGNGKEACGVYRWFPAGRVRPIDIRINFGLVLELLKYGNCVVRDGEIIRSDMYDDRHQYRADRDAMLAALIEAERAIYDQCGTDALDALGAADREGLDAMTLAPAGQALTKKCSGWETFAEAVNWGGGIGRMFDALALIKTHTARALQPIEKSMREATDEACAQPREPGQFHHDRHWAAVVHTAHAAVDSAAAAIVARQWARISPLVERLYNQMASAIAEIIGVDLGGDSVVR